MREFSLKITLLYFIHLTGQEVLCTPTQFLSHVRVTTPAHSYKHGVGDPAPELGRISRQRQSLPHQIRNIQIPQVTQVQFIGYPRKIPSIPFYAEEASRNTSPRHQSLSNAEKIPLLPLSPYKVDSADPESLWPEGLFIPPLTPARLQIQRRLNEDINLNPGYNEDEFNIKDPYLLQGSRAVTAVIKAKHHGELYFHDIPHVESLLNNQELRIKNNLKPHRLGSIRQTWSFNRL